MSDNGNLGLKFRRDGRVIHVGGRMDEFAEYAPLMSLDPPLKLVMRDLRSINSHGLRKWIAFIREWGVRQIEFHECSTPFIDAVNMIGEMVSPNGNMKRIKSVVLPYRCEGCHVATSAVVKVERIGKGQDGLILPDVPCARCKKNMIEQVETEEYFWFLTTTDAA